MGKKVGVEVAPMGGGRVGKIVTFGHLGKPLVGFLHKTDVREIILSGIKGDDIKLGTSLYFELRLKIEQTQDCAREEVLHIREAGRDLGREMSERARPVNCIGKRPAHRKRESSSDMRMKQPDSVLPGGFGSRPGLRP